MNISDIINALSIEEKDAAIYIALPLPDEYTFSQDNWASELCTHYPGPYTSMHIDLRNLKSVNSIICAGFIHLHRSYGCSESILTNASSNVKNIIRTLQLDQIFQLK